jgi:sugar phosphate isomerase/epimerase
VTPISFGVENFTKNHEANKKLFDFAKSIDLKYLTANPSRDSFDSLDKLCEEYKIAIAIHPHGPTNLAKKEKALWTTAEQIMAAVKDHNELIGTCLDTGHLIRMALIGEPLDVVQQIKIMGKRNYGFHLKDNDNKADHNVVFGDPKGVLNVPEVLKALKEVKFGGFMSIEYEYHDDEPTQDVAACVKYLRESIAKV